MSAWSQRDLYRSHTKKNFAWILPQLAKQGARKLEDLLPLVDKDSDHPFILDQVKQLGFYTDCLGKAHWSIPIDVIDETLAKTIVSTAELLVNARSREYTAKEIELWIEHVGPVWKKGMPWMKKAVVNWYAAMQANGLQPEEENQMEGFV